MPLTAPVAVCCLLVRRIGAAGLVEVPLQTPVISFPPRKKAEDYRPVAPEQPRCRVKVRHTRNSLQDRPVTKPTTQQARQGKRVALQAAASLTESRSEPGSQNEGESTDTESRISGVEAPPHVTPQSSEDII
ncbi:hypothetical protein NDU88_005135 [Pleurodeles waltl]|uniref:Uncharacterized protein n=1 Tax=Pleurodeles waltl TaxID=8319 RepID=A0AAV7TVQ6_PLEWA|nr:hypothetical protein NDU88_005135 [Pleurodeles waltl]